MIFGAIPGWRCTVPPTILRSIDRPVGAAKPKLRDGPFPLDARAAWLAGRTARQPSQGRPRPAAQRTRNRQRDGRAGAPLRARYLAGADHAGIERRLASDTARSAPPGGARRRPPDRLRHRRGGGPDRRDADEHGAALDDLVTQRPGLPRAGTLAEQRGGDNPISSKQLIDSPARL